MNVSALWRRHHPNKSMGLANPDYSPAAAFFAAWRIWLTRLKTVKIAHHKNKAARAFEPEPPLRSNLSLPNRIAACERPVIERRCRILPR